MQNRPLTEEEYAIAGVSLRHCTNCGQDKAHNATRWVYYRADGKPRVLCQYCCEQKWERGTSADMALFASTEAGACDEPKSAYSISGLPQQPPPQVDHVFQNLRDLTPDQIRTISLEIPCKAAPGHCLEWFGPVRWHSVLWCLAWLREASEMRPRHLFGRWEKLRTVLLEKLPGPDHEPWRKRIAELAAGEFLFWYSVRLSDAAEAAHKKVASKKSGDAIRKVFEDCKAAACDPGPPSSLKGAADELQRFIDYMEAAVQRVASEE